MNAETNLENVPEIAVVVPTRNEAENVGPLIGEIVAALGGHSFEIIFVDDGSNDGTAEALASADAQHPELRVVTHSQACGQSTHCCHPLLASN